MYTIIFALYFALLQYYQQYVKNYLNNNHEHSRPIPGEKRQEVFYFPTLPLIPHYIRYVVNKSK